MNRFSWSFIATTTYSTGFNNKVQNKKYFMSFKNSAAINYKFTIVFLNSMMYYRMYFLHISMIGSFCKFRGVSEARKLIMIGYNTKSIGPKL